MSDQAIGRRQVLLGSGVAAGGAAIAGIGLASPALAGDDDRGHRLTGSWLVTRQDDVSPGPVLVVVSFAGGKVVISQDIRPSGPPFLGTWVERARGRFRATGWTYSTVPELPGTVEVRLKGRLADGTISGRYVGTFYDPSDQAVLSFEGTFSSVRRIDP